MQLHEDMCQAGFYMRYVEENHEHFAIVDQEIVWYGNMNLLGKDIYRGQYDARTKQKNRSGINGNGVLRCCYPVQ